MLRRHEGQGRASSTIRCRPALPCSWCQRRPVDKIPVLSMGYGLSATAVGSKTFPWGVQLRRPPTGARLSRDSSIMSPRKEGGFDGLKGKKIGFIYLDVGYGKRADPRFLRKLATASMGFSKSCLIPVGVKEMQNQSSHWLTGAQGAPGLHDHDGDGGAMNPTADQGSRQDPLSDGQVHRQLVVRRLTPICARSA